MKFGLIRNLGGSMIQVRCQPGDNGTYLGFKLGVPNELDLSGLEFMTLLVEAHQELVEQQNVDGEQKSLFAEAYDKIVEAFGDAVNFFVVFSLLPGAMREVEGGWRFDQRIFRSYQKEEVRRVFEVLNSLEIIELRAGEMASLLEGTFDFDLGFHALLLRRMQNEGRLGSYSAPIEPSSSSLAYDPEYLPLLREEIDATKKKVAETSEKTDEVFKEEKKVEAEILRLRRNQDQLDTEMATISDQQRELSLKMELNQRELEGLRKKKAALLSVISSEEERRDRLRGDLTSLNSQQARQQKELTGLVAELHEEERKAEEFKRQQEEIKRLEEAKKAAEVKSLFQDLSPEAKQALLAELSK